MGRDLGGYIESSFMEALEKGYIQVYYQPVIRSVSGKLCSFEALARWIDPTLGLISPGEFIPVLERIRAIHLLDIHIIREACARMRWSVDHGETPIPVSINLSRLDFELCDIFSEVKAAVDTHQVQRDSLYVEITESVVAEQGSTMRDTIDAFRAAGFQVWMDDFGSGYSSLNVLKDFQFDELKLDMQFLSSFDQRSQRILVSVIRMAKEIGLHTLAEGVETEEQVRYLRNSGCEKMQGFFFGRPMPFDEAMEHLASRGIEVEKPAERSYYEDIGRVDFLSAVPFMSQEEKDSLVSARQLNSIPLALAEVRREDFSILFYNTAFEETACGIGVTETLFSQQTLRKPHPYTILSGRVINLVESTRASGEASMYFVSNEDYYEVRTKRVATMRDACCILFSMRNLSKMSQSEKTDRLDESLRQVYSLYERVTLLDVKADALMPLYVGTSEELPEGNRGLRELNEAYNRNWIHPEDREAHRELCDLSTLEDRLRLAGKVSITKLLRTHVSHGRYEWKAYTLLRLDDQRYLELIRNVHREVLSFAEQAVSSGSFVAAHDVSSVPEEYVWRALVNSDIINLFWKDEDRRFLGASRGFLDYYGFQTVDDIRGKNDEDLGWHVQPGNYRNDELEVINEGVETRYVPGHCIRNGENRDIYASKGPLYDRAGQVCGLVGCFVDKDLLMANDARGEETKRRDILTGLLNSRGIHEEASLFRDEYYLRGTDFTRIHIAIDDMNTINNQYGFDFGDKAIARLGRELARSFGQAAAVGRCSGHQLAVLCQVHEAGEEAELRERARSAAERVRHIDGTPLTLYVSVGSCRFSETENLGEQEKKAEVRQLADQDEHLSAASKQVRAEEIFHLYDNLPIAYAVYRVHLDEHNKASDATLFYVNHVFEESCGMMAADLLSKGARELFPTLPDEWYEVARRAAYEGEIITDARFHFAQNGLVYYMTASQVIHSGYCCFTFQRLDV